MPLHYSTAIHAHRLEIIIHLLVASISVHTFSVLARVGLSIELIALVHVDVAIGSNVSLSTSAPVGIGSIWQ